MDNKICCKNYIKHIKNTEIMDYMTEFNEKLHEMFHNFSEINIDVTFIFSSCF